MTPEEHSRARDVFLAVSAAPAAQQESVLAAQCGSDEALRAEVQRLLAHHREETLGQFSPTVVMSEDVPVTDAGDREAGHMRYFAPGTVIGGRYRLVARLGGGGMGDVYRADDLTLNQVIALKFLPPHLAQEPTRLEQLRREVRLARTVTHPNVCRTYDLDEADGEQFISMEYVDGEDLASLVRRIGRVSGDKALEIAHQLCAGLSAAHAAGVLHCDLKPANVMLDGRGRVRITDFGLAGSVAELRDDRRLAGTPAYMAPEQFAGRKVDERTDVYALGLVLYELFTGQPAQAGRSIADFARLHQTVDPVPPFEIVPNIEPEVEQTICACLQKNPELRPPSALAVSARLPQGSPLVRALAAGETPAPEVVAAATVPHALGTRHVTWVFVLALALLAGFLAIGGRGRFDFNVGAMKAPAVLVERARSLAPTTAAPAVARQAWGYIPADEVAGQLLDAGSAAAFQVVPDVGVELAFWYRVLPQDYRPISNETLQVARIKLRDPPENRPGMNTIVLDATGRLLAMTRYPTEDDGPAAHDWTSYLAAADLNAGELSEAEPTLEAPTYADARKAWIGAGGDAANKLRVEGASLRGMPLLFAVLHERAASATLGFDPLQRKAIAVGVLRIFLIVALLLALPLAGRNLQRGRGDARTALRLAMVLFGLRFAVWLLSASHYSLRLGELHVVQWALFDSVFLALAVGLFYLALEPLARRYWPYSLISWTRLSSGRGWDAIVGQHVLIGAALGILWATLLALDRLAVSAWGLALRPLIWEEHITLPLLGGRYAVSLAVETLANALIYGMLIMLILALLQAILKRRRPAAIAAAIIAALLFLPYGNSALTAWLVVGVVCVGSAIWATIRYGLLTIMTAILVVGLLSMFPITFDTRNWYSDLTLFAISMVLAVTLYGFFAARRAPARA